MENAASRTPAKGARMALQTLSGDRERLASGWLGLVAFGATWAVALNSLVALATTTWFAGIAHGSAVDQLRHG